MTTTTESNMLNMHQSPLVLGWGQNNINASYPINAKKLQIVFPSSGNPAGWQPNQNLEYRQLLDKNSAMSLHGSYFQIQYSVGRTKNWLPAYDTPPPAIPAAGDNVWNDPAKPASVGGPVRSLQDLQPLDSLDRLIMYSHWNPSRLIQNCTLWLGSTNVETVNNVPLISDAKYAFYSPDAVKTTMSDCFVQPPDGQCINGTPMFHQFVAPGTVNIVDNWLDTTICTYNSYSISGRNDLTNAAQAWYSPAAAAGQVCVQPLEYFIRNGQYVCSQFDAHCITSVRDAPQISFSGIATTLCNTAAGINWFSYALQANTPCPSTTGIPDPPVPADTYDTNYCGGILNAPAISAGATGGGKLGYDISTMSRRIPLSSLFGFCEQNVLVPSNLVQINLVRARDSEYCQAMWQPQAIDTPFATLPQRQYGIFIKNISLILKYYDLNQTAADILSQDQLLTVNHYSLYSNNIIGTGSGSVALQSYAGLKSLLVRVTPTYAMPGQSVCVGKSGSISVIYRGKQTPLQLENYALDLIDPVGGEAGTYNGEPACIAYPSTYFEEYSSWNGNCWNGISASLAPSAGFNMMTWFKSQFTVAFNFVEDQSQNADTVAAPVQLNYAFGAPVYAMQPMPPTITAVVPHLTVPAGINPLSFTIQVIFLRTNIIKYLGASRQFVFVTNGSS